MEISVEEITQQTYRLETRIPGLNPIFTVYFIKDKTSILIEPGPAAIIPAIQKAVKELDLKNLEYIIPTHIHVDHAGGVGALALLFPTAKVLAHPRGAKHLANPARLVANTKRIYGDDVETRSGPMPPVPESRIKIIDDGDTFIIGGRTLQVIHAPGHSPDHFGILDRSLNGLFCGEALGLPPHLLPSVAPYAFDEEAYLQTIEKLRKLRPSTILYSHGRVETAPENAFSRATENTHIYGQMVLDGIKNGDSIAEIARRFAADVKRRFGLLFGPEGSQIFVAGYSMYYEKKGLA